MCVKYICKIYIYTHKTELSPQSSDASVSPTDPLLAVERCQGIVVEKATNGVFNIGPKPKLVIRMSCKIIRSIENSNLFQNSSACFLILLIFNNTSTNMQKIEMETRNIHVTRNREFGKKPNSEQWWKEERKMV